MTSDERDITGAMNAAELRTMRDAVSEIADSLAELTGAVKERARADQHWQDKVECWIQEEPDRIARGAAAAVDACRLREEPEIREAVAYYEKAKGAELDRRAISGFLGDSARLVLTLAIVATLALIILLAALRHDDEVVRWTAVVAAAAPFFVLALGRGLRR